MGSPLVITGIVVYVVIGTVLMLWIKRDSEFRNMDTSDFLAYGSIIFWPITAILYMVFRSPEALDDQAAKSTYQDFANFMRERKASDTDFMKHVDSFKKTSPDDPLELQGGTGEEYRDHHIEELMNTGAYQEALRTANDMLRFAREQQEYGRVEAYERYIFEIKKKRSADYT